jgi:hypothetical protein
MKEHIPYDQVTMAAIRLLLGGMAVGVTGLALLGATRKRGPLATTAAGPPEFEGDDKFATTSEAKRNFFKTLRKSVAGEPYTRLSMYIDCSVTHTDRMVYVRAQEPGFWKTVMPYSASEVTVSRSNAGQSRVYMDDAIESAGIYVPISAVPDLEKALAQWKATE